jgi:L-ascorbate metabolism protein UlaG (beta-lactamase superfamily)
MQVTPPQRRAPPPFQVRYLGGPTALLELGGLRLLTDPTFDPPGVYPLGTRTLVKTAYPAVPADGLGPIDAVLLSHDQHPDNLDRRGRAFLAHAPLVLSTSSAQTRLGPPVQALPSWSHVDLPVPDGGTVRITGVPAQHGPDGPAQLTGEVTGFLLSGDTLPTVYVSGDNASLPLLQAIGGRFAPVDVALLFAGGAQTALLGDAYLTLTSEQAAEATRILEAGIVVPLHFEGWTHFTQGRDSLREAFERARLGQRLRLPSPGDQIDLGVPLGGLASA